MDPEAAPVKNVPDTGAEAGIPSTSTPSRRKGSKTAYEEPFVTTVKVSGGGSIQGYTETALRHLLVRPLPTLRKESAFSTLIPLEFDAGRTAG